MKRVLERINKILDKLAKPNVFYDVQHGNYGIGLTGEDVQRYRASLKMDNAE